jgi:hypothetical protein
MQPATAGPATAIPGPAAGRAPDGGRAAPVGRSPYARAPGTVNSPHSKRMDDALG